MQKSMSEPAKNNRAGLGADMKEWIQTEDILARLEKSK
jgi:hypothetical protein